MIKKYPNGITTYCADEWIDPNKLKHDPFKKYKVSGAWFWESPRDEKGYLRKRKKIRSTFRGWIRYHIWGQVGIERYKLEPPLNKLWKEDKNWPNEKYFPGWKEFKNPLDKILWKLVSIIPDW